LAPALFIIAHKQKEICLAQTPKEVFTAYYDGCGVEYNPNHVVESIYDLIDEVFIEGQSKEPKQQPFLGTTGGTTSLVEAPSDVK